MHTSAQNQAHAEYTGTLLHAGEARTKVLDGEGHAVPGHCRPHPYPPTGARTTMPSVTLTLTDTPTGEVAISTDFKPAVGNPCSPAQAAALDVISRTRKAYGLELVSAAAAPQPSAAREVRQ
jgi:hypothetical protein